METPLETAHERNKRIYGDLQQLRSNEASSLMEWIPEYANYYPRLIARLQDLYSKLLAASETLQYISMEGVTEIAFRSRTQTLVWALEAAPGREVADVLLLHLRDQLQEIEEKILEARGRLAGELTGGTTEEWHHNSVRYLALLLEKGPMLSETGNQAA